MAFKNKAIVNDRNSHLDRSTEEGEMMCSQFSNLIFLALAQLLSPTSFEDNATYSVLGDMNTPFNPRLDSSSLNICYDSSKSSVAKLGVVDAWRIHFRHQKRVLSGPN
ncbi:hypothetical protein PsorP6_011678 [Peronosclerospora sorghi]|uniref:Uncharacterized protein n=1 Tax=Peronosclerospora sorghi TaxID=230839 RepID=A0ACC0WK81_9STRA|nr:hypothetical protein PsorP6_011678 [Peronosclerospora sorghi]